MTIRKCCLLASAAASATLLALPALDAQATLVIDVQQPKAPVSKMLYGLITEEINYSHDGGLYAELVWNRTFRSDWSGILNWYLVEKWSSSAKITVDKNGPSAALNSSAKLEVARADANNPAGLIKEGYWSTAVRPISVESAAAIQGERMQYVMPGYSIQVVTVNLKPASR